MHRTPRSSHAAGAFVLAVALAGCAGAEGAADRHMAEMRDAIGRIQADHDLSDDGARALGVFEDAEVEAPAAPAPRAPQAPSMLRAVQIGEGEDTREPDDPNDPGERPEIRLRGTGRGAEAWERPRREPSRTEVVRVTDAGGADADVRGPAGPKESR